MVDFETKDVATPSAPSGAGQPAARHADTGAVFRVVTHGGHKHGFKLEAIFWKIIQLAAATEHKRIGAYVESVLKGHSEHENKASVLRTSAAEWLSGRLADAVAKALSPRTIGKMVQAVPVPSFTMDNDLRITSQNHLFVELLRTHIEEGAIVGDAAVRIRFQTDAKAIREILVDAKRPFFDDVLHIQYQGRSLDRRVRVITIDTAQGTSMGFLVFVTN